MSTPALLATVAALTALLAAPALGAPPDEGECPTLTATPDAESAPLDAATIQLTEGMVLNEQVLTILSRLIPPEVWRYREAFFYEGMRMVVGYCHRRYATAPFYREATEKFRGQPKLDEDGNLENYKAGLPFPPEDMEADASDKALRWAWNLQMRYRGAGHRGKFKLTDLPTALGGILEYEGDFFYLQTEHRADLAEDDYRIEEGEDMTFAAGGEFQKPFDARHLAWRQFRPSKASRKFEEPDDVFVYVPTMRKSRRAASPWVDGVFFPRYTAAGDAGGGGLAFGGELGGGMGAINPTASQSIQQSEHVRRGFVGLALRPNAFLWRIIGEREVLAPINAERTGWPINPDRNYGLSGLSVASDRWDVRHAVVIEGALKMPDEDVRTLTVYVDYQTRMPLFWITRASGRRFMEVGILVHRFTDDVYGYPEWPGGVPASVFEPVAASFYNALEGGGGWRRESYDMSSVPFESHQIRRMTTANQLDRGH